MSDDFTVADMLQAEAADHHDAVTSQYVEKAHTAKPRSGPWIVVACGDMRPNELGWLHCIVFCELPLPLDKILTCYSCAFTSDPLQLVASMNSLLLFISGAHWPICFSYGNINSF